MSLSLQIGPSPSRGPPDVADPCLAWIDRQFATGAPDDAAARAHPHRALRRRPRRAPRPPPRPRRRSRHDHPGLHPGDAVPAAGQHPPPGPADSALQGPTLGPLHPPARPRL
ncbi:hypothetical protein PVAP13_5KG224700 [Panicum virgatum]|uniref:Uncharacterized protein n=1 Tax=Panicum virgatum TaxID=38727 RepID=A0A8T0SGV9_PANVG|nr:hypothetical protein PVAP13_5KG224700 [Panicum virgatum]